MMNAQIKEMLNAFEKGNFQKSYILALELSSSKFFDIKYKILSFSSFKLSKFKDTINYCEAYLKKTRDNDLQILKTLTSSYLNINDFEKTILYGEKIVKISKKDFFTLNLLGIAYSKQKDYDQSNKYLKESILINNDFLESKYNLGINNFNLKNYKEAEKIFDEIIIKDKSFKDSYFMVGLIKNKLKEYGSSLTIFKELSLKDPSNVDYYFNIGLTYQKKKDYLSSNKFFLKCIDIDNKNEKYFNVLGINYERLNELEKSITFFEKAININPKYDKLYINLGNVYRKLSQFDKSLNLYDTAITLNNKNPISKYNKSLNLLLNGNFNEGLKYYRFRGNGVDSNKKLFELKNITNKNILVIKEQGLGDSINIARYLVSLADEGAKVTFLVQKPLEKLMNTLDKRVKIITKEDRSIAYDYSCSLMDLPLIFKTTLENIPIIDPYLKADKDLIKKWREKIDINKFNIGIAWQGNKDAAVDEGRSFSLDLFNKISQIKNIQLISLQKNDGIEQLNEFKKNFNILDFGDDLDRFGSFQDTAAIIKNVDLVISPDTSINHLASALGAKVFLLLQKVPYWFWQLDTEKSPWYKNIKIFRQTISNDWTDVFDRVKEELEQIIKNN